MLKQVAVYLGKSSFQNEFHKSFAIKLPNPIFLKFREELLIVNP